MLNKLFRASLLMATVLSIALVSCKNDDQEIPTAPVGNIIAKIDGKSFQAIGGAETSRNGILIAGANGNEVLAVIVTKKAAVGTYDVTGGISESVLPVAAVDYTPDGGNTYFSSAFATEGEKVGTVTLSEIDEVNKTVSGTFSSKSIGSDSGSKNITEGSFTKIPYTIELVDFISAKVDGEDFESTDISLTIYPDAIGINGYIMEPFEAINLVFPNDVTTGTYPLGELGSDYFATYRKGDNHFKSATGTITITKHDVSDRRVEGTFSFTSVPLTGDGEGPDITMGSFSVSYE